MELAIFAVIFWLLGGLLLKGLEHLLSRPKAIDYDKRWSKRKYVSMIHQTRELEKTTGMPLTECRCPEHERSVENLRPPKGPSAVRLSPRAYACRMCGITMAANRLCAPCNRVALRRGEHPSWEELARNQRPEQVPAFASVRKIHDGTGFGEIAYWEWTDSATGKRMSLPQNLAPPLANSITADYIYSDQHEKPVLVLGRPKEVPATQEPDELWDITEDGWIEPSPTHEEIIDRDLHGRVVAYRKSAVPRF